MKHRIIFQSRSTLTSIVLRCLFNEEGSLRLLGGDYLEGMAEGMVEAMVEDSPDDDVIEHEKRNTMKSFLLVLFNVLDCVSVQIQFEISH